MDTYKNFPAPLRIGIPIAVAFMLLLVLYITVLKAPAPTTILETQNFDTYTTAKDLLTQKGMEFEDEAASSGTYMLTVTSDDATDARTMLKSAGVQDLSGTAKAIKCPAAPGFTATKAANQRADNCTNAKAVQTLLLGLGATAALVNVSQSENDSFVGPEMTKSVQATVFLPEAKRADWPAADIARQVALTVGTSTKRVIIGDSTGHAMFDGLTAGGDKSGAAGAGNTAAASGLGCADIAGATEVITKQTAISNCKQGELSTQLQRVLGESKFFVVTVDTEVDSTSSQINSTTNTKGPVISESSQKGGDSAVTDKSSPPNTEAVQKTDPAGDVKWQAITVTLDRDHVSTQQELAVKRILTASRNVDRGDPAPSVTRIEFAKGAGEAPVTNSVDKLQTQVKDEQQQIANKPIVTTQMPKSVLAVVAVIVIGLLTAILLLWRRTVGIADERKRMEDAFQQDQRLFENFAQQNPDDIAKDLETLFGQPSAQRA